MTHLGFPVFVELQLQIVRTRQRRLWFAIFLLAAAREFAVIPFSWLLATSSEFEHSRNLVRM